MALQFFIAAGLVASVALALQTDHLKQTDEKQYFMKMLNSLVHVNNARVQALRKLTRMQDSDVADYNIHALRTGGPLRQEDEELRKDDEQQLVLIVVNDEDNFNTFRDNLPPNSEDVGVELLNELTSRARGQSVKDLKELCTESCKDALKSVCRNMKCTKTYKKQFIRQCVYYCIEMFK